MQDENVIKLHDFYQACILKTLGFPLLRLERQSGNFVTFVFDDPNHKASDAIDNYWNRKTSVVARDLIETINELKTRIHSL